MNVSVATKHDHHRSRKKYISYKFLCLKPYYIKGNWWHYLSKFRTFWPPCKIRGGVDENG